MKNYFLSVWIAVMMLLANGCYKDDINDLKDEVDKLKQEQQAQAEKMQTYETLMAALDQKLTVASVTPIASGQRIVFSDGSSIDVASSIVRVEDLNGEVSFRMSDGTVINIHKIETIAMYILSEGTWGSNNSDLAFFDGTQLTTKFYTTQNGGALGDVGNSLKLYGTKMYCAVTGKNMESGGSIKVIDPKSGQLVKSIEATDADGKPDQPRHIALHNGMVYFSMYSGAIMRVDTATLEVTGRAKLSGAYPEGICAYQGHLYVCNSGQGNGNTISVVDIATFAETTTITVPANPSMIEATSTGDIYFTTADNTWGGGNPSDLHRFHASNPANITTFNIRATKIAMGSDYIYTVDSYTDYSTFESETYLKKIHLRTGQVSDFVADGTAEDIMMGYNLSLNPTNGDLYILNQGNDVYMYTSDGSLIRTFKTGVPYGSSIVFINR